MKFKKIIYVVESFALENSTYHLKISTENSTNYFKTLQEAPKIKLDANCVSFPRIFEDVFLEKSDILLPMTKQNFPEGFSFASLLFSVLF